MTVGSKDEYSLSIIADERGLRILDLRFEIDVS